MHEMTYPQLSSSTLERAKAVLERPDYDRTRARVGVVHFGPGAFHRTHQAYAFHRLLSQDLSFGVCAASLRSGDLEAALAPQDGLYVLAQRDREERFLAIGSLLERVTAPSAPARLRARLADPAVRVATSTVTEKGYCLDGAGELDFTHPDVRADLRAGAAPKSLIGWLVQAYADRRATGAAPSLAVPCDNLSKNGAKLRKAVLALAEAKDKGLARWIGEQARFASSMVDSITPATDEALKTLVRERCGVTCAAPVQREAFVQWAVEATDAPGQPDWAFAGATVTSDICVFEQAKLRLLNGAHSALAYLGGLAGFETVAQAIGDPVLRRFIERLWSEEAAPGLIRPPGLDLDAYQHRLLARFDNPILAHRLAQIAQDGSQKTPIRLFAPLWEAAAAGRPLQRLALAAAAWMVFVVREAKAGRPIADPLAIVLSEVGRRADLDPLRDTARFLSLRQIFPDPSRTPPSARTALATAYGRLVRLSPHAAIAACETQGLGEGGV
jgi:fructuronate reductase